MLEHHLPAHGVAALCLALAGCGATTTAPAEPTPGAPEGTGGEPPVKPPAPPPERASGVTGTDGVDAAAGPPPECPPDMAHVKKSFCTDMDRRCLKSEYDKANRITICHRFEEGRQSCVGKRVELDFCIDHYEFPNQKGAHPPWMVDWYDAMGHCATKGKRLCYESEWVAACEGPDEKPFPYGWSRDPTKCNIDNAWVEPSLKKVYSKDRAVSEAELARLDRSKPSGSMQGCVSDYGVFDLTGNMDEWAIADRDRPEERAVFVALKGGAWGHVRNACRPVTTSHEPEFRYYFVSFRCCADAASVTPFEGTAPAP